MIDVTNPQNSRPDWAVSVTAVPPDDHAIDSFDRDRVILDVTEVLEMFGATGAAAQATEDRIEATFTVVADRAIEAIDLGTKAWDEAMAKVVGQSWPIARLEAATYDMVRSDYLDTALPELVGVSEVAEMLGVSKQRVSALQHLSSFPRPLAQIAAGPIWVAGGIRNFAEQRTSRPGRPKKVAEQNPLVGS